MRVLLTNDDGIHAPGLWALAETVSAFARILIVAPDREKSGIGTAVSLHRPLRIKKVKPLSGDIETYTVEGTPGDCVILALETLCSNDKIDLLISGINEGSNLGQDIFISGTVGAALHGYFHEIPSFAISVAALENLHFEAASRLAAVVASGLSGTRSVNNNNFCININLPNLPPDKIKGVEITRIGRRSYTETVKEEGDGRKKLYWIRRGKEVSEIEAGTDIEAIKNDKISITPIFSNMAREALTSYLASIRKNIKKALRIES